MTSLESSSELLPTLFETIRDGIIGSVVEMHSLLPDSMMFGALLLYVLTHNLSYGILAVFIFEMVLSHKFIGWMFAQTVGAESRPSPVNIKCRAGFKTAQLNALRSMSHDQYPSYGLFSITSIATYLGLATNEFSSTFREMGAEWSSRSIVAFVFIGLVLPIFIAVHLMNCNETKTEIAIAISLAIVCGWLFYLMNKNVFGTEAMNFLGVPNMISKQENGDPIYICSATSM